MASVPTESHVDSNCEVAGDCRVALAKFGEELIINLQKLCRLGDCDIKFLEAGPRK